MSTLKQETERKKEEKKLRERDFISENQNNRYNQQE